MGTKYRALGLLIYINLTAFLIVYQFSGGGRSGGGAGIAIRREYSWEWGDWEARPSLRFSLIS